MSRVIHATFEDGVLKPDAPLDLAPRTRVRLTLEPEMAVAQPTGGESTVPDDEWECWRREADRLAQASSDPEEWDRFEAALAEADRSAKQAVRRAMEAR
jgi:predicted DNA-binding antitoxin AbrB/MazE fold protein